MHEPKVGDYDIENLTQESLKAMLSEAFKRGFDAAMDLAFILEEALERIAKPCAVNSNFSNECDCLNGLDCADIAKEALKKFGGAE